MSTAVTPLKTAAETELAKLFAGAKFAGAETTRNQAFAHVEKAGLPHRRIEAWHYTDLRSLMRTAAPMAPAPSAEWASKRPWSLVKDDDVFSFVDGWLVKSPKVPKGVTVTSLADDSGAFASALNKGVDLSGDIVTSLNTAFMTGGLLIEVAAGVAVADPLSLAFETTGATASQARVVVMVGEGASISIIETHRGAAGIAAQENTVVEFVLAKSATVDHVRINAADKTSQTLSTVAASVAAEASFSTLSFTTGASLSRHQVFTRIHGDDAKIGVRGVTLLRGTQHADTTLVSEHDALNGEGRKLFKTVVDDEARGVFQGKIIVKPNAQKTDGKMASNTLLLGENSSMHAKPELEIFADDVVCGHGATVGALDDNLLFYLMSRGIPRNEAEGLMIQAFAGDALEHVAHEGLRDVLMGMTVDWLNARK
ncbi:MAG: Fe-S cluster assembly protein SufD [Beijerinckiaceae bacterium]